MADQNPATMPEVLEMYNGNAVLDTELKTYGVRDQQTHDQAADHVRKCNALIKKRKDFFKEPKATAKQSWQNWVDLEKALIGPVEDIKKSLTKKMGVWFDAEEAKLKAEQVKLQAEMEAEAAEMNDGTDIPFVAPPMPTRPEVKGHRKVWDFEVTDFASIPDEYKLVNERALKAIATSTKGTANVPGVQFKQTSVVSVR